MINKSPSISDVYSQVSKSWLTFMECDVNHRAIAWQFVFGLFDLFSFSRGIPQKWHLHCEWQRWQMLHSIDVDNTAQYTWCSHKHALGLYTRIAKTVVSSLLWNGKKKKLLGRPTALFSCVSDIFSSCRNTECTVVRHVQSEEYCSFQLQIHL